MIVVDFIMNHISKQQHQTEVTLEESEIIKDGMGMEAFHSTYSGLWRERGGGGGGGEW